MAKEEPGKKPTDSWAFPGGFILFWIVVATIILVVGLFVFL
jgi:hypothetical protein